MINHNHNHNKSLADVELLKMFQEPVDVWMQSEEDAMWEQEQYNGQVWFSKVHNQLLNRKRFGRDAWENIAQKAVPEHQGLLWLQMESCVVVGWVSFLLEMLTGNVYLQTSTWCTDTVKYRLMIDHACFGGGGPGCL